MEKIALAGTEPRGAACLLDLLPDGPVSNVTWEGSTQEQPPAGSCGICCSGSSSPSPEWRAPFLPT